MDTRSSTSASARRNVPVRLIAAIAVALVVAGVAFAGIARATDQPSFCGAACHEMSPFHTAWTQGAHKNIACIECHVDVGTVARMEHKVVALKEVATHVTGDYSFPGNQPPPVPSERCKRCHPNVTLTSTGFSHAEHAKRGECVMCHTTVGHDVSVSLAEGSRRLQRLDQGRVRLDQDRRGRRREGQPRRPQDDPVLTLP